MNPKLTALPAALATLLSACAADITNYPSLARRTSESAEGTDAPTASSSELAPSADLTARLAALVDQARQAHQQFAARTAKAGQAVAAKDSFGSERWGTAEVALADLESARSDAMIALADLDGLYAAARIAAGDAGAIAQAREAVIAIVREQDQSLAQLRGQLSR